MQEGRKAVWSIPYVFVAFFPSLKQNFIAYRSSKVISSSDCIFEIHQLWQSSFSRVYSNSYCSYSFEPEIIKIGQWSHKKCSNNIVNFEIYDNFNWMCHVKVNERKTYSNQHHVNTCININFNVINLTLTEIKNITFSKLRTDIKVVYIKRLNDEKGLI